MKNLHLFILLLVGLFFASCNSDMSHKIIISDTGSIYESVGMDLGSFLSMMSMAKEDTIAETSTKPLGFKEIIQNPEKLGSKVDTTIALYNEAEVASMDLTEEEIEALKKFKIRLNLDQEEEVFLMDFVLEYDENTKRDFIMTTVQKVASALSEDEDADPLKEEDVDNPLSDMFNATSDFDIDLKNGKFHSLGSEMPHMEELDKIVGDSLTADNIAMLRMMISGKVNTLIELPGKIYDVRGVEFEKLGENKIMVTYDMADVIIDNEFPEFFIDFEPTEAITDPKVTEVWEPEPEKVSFSKDLNVPSDAIVLFDGKNTSAWKHKDGKPVQWNVKKGAITVKPGTGDIMTKETFGDCQLHIEWKSPKEPNRKGQDKGNSGVFFQGKYEVQVLNSFDNRTYSNGQAASIYKQYIPEVNATKPVGDWNTYDIIFHAPKFAEDGSLTEEGYFTVIHNGVLVQDHVRIQGTTEYIGRPKMIPHGDGPIILQDHSNEVSFRNIWLRKL